MKEPAWLRTLPAAVTVCDAEGTILEMNEASARTFEKDGGAALVGRSLLDCHPERARSRLEAMHGKGEGRIYTIEKQGKRKLIAQLPWWDRGRFGGLVEISIELPDAMEHFVRG